MATSDPTGIAESDLDREEAPTDRAPLPGQVLTLATGRLVVERVDDGIVYFTGWPEIRRLHMFAWLALAQTAYRPPGWRRA